MAQQPACTGLAQLDHAPEILFAAVVRIGHLDGAALRRELQEQPELRARPAAENDPRVTWVGRFLRKTRLDELPQVINVLRGEMSLVGPRSERPELVAHYEKQVPFYRSRLLVKPGLTGWAQVNFGYAATVEDTVTKLEYDLYYITHWTPWLDLRILWMTVWHGLVNRNAY